MIEILLYFLLGLVAGLAAIAPGIHTNTIAQLLVTVGDPVGATVAIAAATAVGTMLALLPAIFLFVPEQTTIVSVLPGHQLVREGKGFAAIRICVAAALTTLLLAPFFIPIAYLLIPAVYAAVRPYIAPLLALVCAFFILNEKKKIHAAAVFVLAGAFGYVVLSSPILREPLFAPFVGLFALSNLLLAARVPWQIPAQNKNVEIPVAQLFGIVAIGSLLGIFADILPAVGSSAQFATFGAFAAPNAQSFLALTTSISVAHTASAYITLHTIEKARIGSIALIRQLVGIPEIDFVLIYLSITAAAVAIGAGVLLVVARSFLNFVRRTNITMLNASLLVYLLALILLIDGLNGLAVAGVATAIGLLAPLCDVRRTQLMGFLIIPTLVYLIL